MKSNYDKLDQEILNNLGSLKDMVEGAPGKLARQLLKPYTFTGVYKLIEARLQSLRKAGKIVFDRPNWKLPIVYSHKEEEGQISVYLGSKLVYQIRKESKPSKLPYTKWERGDQLRVISVDKGDPFELGQIVTHADTDGNDVPFCTGSGFKDPYAMCQHQLEFVERPE